MRKGGYKKIGEGALHTTAYCVGNFFLLLPSSLKMILHPNYPTIFRKNDSKNTRLSHSDQQATLCCV